LPANRSPFSTDGTALKAFRRVTALLTFDGACSMRKRSLQSYLGRDSRSRDDASVIVAHRPTHGFTLIEVMIVVAVVAILAAIAMPSYEAQMRKSARAEAQSFITDVASRQQQYMVDRRSYAPSLAALGMPAPASLSSKYTFAVAVTDGPPPTYTISATAVGRQAYDQCGGTSAVLLTLNNAGARSPPDCW